MNLENVIPAPQWLKDRMEAARNRPPPTAEEVARQFRASEEWQIKYGFSCVEKIKKASYLR